MSKSSYKKGKAFQTKRELEALFPGVKFGVYLASNDSDIVMSVFWEDGPTDVEVATARGVKTKDHYSYMGPRGSINWKIVNKNGGRDFIFNTSRFFSKEVYEDIIGQLEGAGIMSDAYSTFPKNGGMYLTLESQDSSTIKNFCSIVHRRYPASSLKKRPLGRG